MTVSAENDNAITVTDTFSDSNSEAASTKIMMTFATTTLTVTLSPGAIYIAVGGVLFFLIMAVVLGVTAGLLVRRMKHNAITRQLSDMKSKSPKLTPSGTSWNHQLWKPHRWKGWSLSSKK
jgi:preprotein translocase subunit SecF